MSYKVTAPLVIIPNADGKSGDWYGYQDAIVPEGHNDERCKQLLKEKFLEVVKDEPTEPTTDTVDAILAEVGTDKDKAAAAIEAEKAGKNRTTLLTKLQAVLDAS